MIVRDSTCGTSKLLSREGLPKKQGLGGEGEDDARDVAGARGARQSGPGGGGEAKGHSSEGRVEPPAATPDARRCPAA